MKVHETADGKPYKCTECDKSFTRKTGLKLHHDVVHLGLRIHSCTECEKTFSTASKAKFHIKMHKEGKPFACQYCNQGFTNKRNLLAHEKKHFANEKKCKKGEEKDTSTQVV